MRCNYWIQQLIVQKPGEQVIYTIKTAKNFINILQNLLRTSKLLIKNTNFNNNNNNNNKLMEEITKIYKFNKVSRISKYSSRYNNNHL